MQDQRRFVFQSARVGFVRHFAKSIFNERSLQRRFFALNPTSQYKFSDGDRVTVFVFDHLTRYLLRESAELVECLRATFVVGTRVAALLKWNQVFSAVRVITASVSHVFLCAVRNRLGS